MSCEAVIAKAQLFKDRLQRHLECALEVVVTDNRSTMLRVLKRTRSAARLSLHQMFLEAPDEVVQEIAHFVRGRQGKNKNLLRGYIQSHLAHLDYSHTIEKSALKTQGRVYDLQQLYNKINATYFNGQLKLAITWYGRVGYKSRRRPCRRIVFGEYIDHMKLIKIHRLLDDSFFPEYFVSYVIFHEMAHHMVPGFIDGSGCFRLHGADFKKQERRYVDYERALAWERANKEALFQRL